MLKNEPFQEGVSIKTQVKLKRLSSAEESNSETSGRIFVGKLENRSIKAEVYVMGCKPGKRTGRKISLVTDTGGTPISINHKLMSN